MNTLIIVLITGGSWLAVILMIKALEWVGFRALRCNPVCLGLSNWPIRCSADPHTSTPSTSVPARGGTGSVSAGLIIVRQIRQAACSCGLRLLWLSGMSDTDHPSQTKYEFIWRKWCPMMIIVCIYPFQNVRETHKYRDISPFFLFLVCFSLFLCCPAPSFMLLCL